MTEKTAGTYKLPGFRYGNSDIPPMKISASLIDNLKSGKDASDLAPLSAPMLWRNTLYLIGRDLTYGDEDTSNLPEPVKNTGILVYNRMQKKGIEGTWYKDAAIIKPKNQCPKGWRQPQGDNYRFCIYLQDIAGFEKKGDIRQPKYSQDTKEIKLWLPQGDWYGVPTEDGLLHPEAGTYFETAGNKGDAIKRWIEAGFTEQQAINELSKFYRKNEGLSAVYSWSNADNGSLCVDLDYEPCNRSNCLGSFPASRSPSGARQPANSDFRLLTSEQVKNYEADRKELQKIKSGMKSLIGQKE